MWFQTHVRDSGQFNLSSKDKVLVRQERLPKTAPDSECFHFSELWYQTYTEVLFVLLLA